MKIKCPDCKRTNNTNLENGKVQCKKCLQFIIIENKEPIYCIPKDLFV